ncbi:MAG TPA: hypothetical protein DCY91_18555 [Cyanobacteria bacterium UBA11370]|nr:hypothetical protein [Cyanobacteria bacterium UBA11370]
MNPQNTQSPTHKNPGRSRLNATAYRAGYLRGKTSEHYSQDENRIIRENNSAARGLLWGLTLAAIAILLGGAIFLLIQAKQSPTSSIETNPIPDRDTTSQPQNYQQQIPLTDTTLA